MNAIPVALCMVRAQPSSYEYGAIQYLKELTEPETELVVLEPEPTQLIVVSGGEPRTTTLAIAEGTGVEHASVILLVRTYLNDIAEFGQCRFEIASGAPRPQGGTGRPTEYALLNEPQRKRNGLRSNRSRLPIRKRLLRRKKR